VLRVGAATGQSAGAKLEGCVRASRNPAWIGARATLELPELEPGGRRDLGILKLQPK
jgi:hypothetical protein